MKAVILQDKLGKQNFHEVMGKVFEPVIKIMKDVPEEVTKILTKTSIKNNKAIDDLNNKLLEIVSDGGIIASYLLAPSSKLTNPEHPSRFKLAKDPNSNRVNDLLIKDTTPITLHDNLLTFHDSNKEFELKADLLKMITNKNYNVDLASLSDKKFMYDFAKEMYFDVKALGNKSTRDRTLIKLLKSPGLMISACGVSNTIFLPSDPDELRDRLNLIMQKVQAGNNSDKINDEIIVLIDKFIENKCISKKQHKQT